MPEGEGDTSGSPVRDVCVCNVPRCPAGAQIAGGRTPDLNRPPDPLQITSQRSHRPFGQNMRCDLSTTWTHPNSERRRTRILGFAHLAPRALKVRSRDSGQAGQCAALYDIVRQLSECCLTKRSGLGRRPHRFLRASKRKHKRRDREGGRSRH